MRTSGTIAVSHSRLLTADLMIYHPCVSAYILTWVFSMQTIAHCFYVSRVRKSCTVKLAGTAHSHFVFFFSFSFQVCLFFFYCRALLVYTTSSNQQNQSPWTQSQRRRAAICSKWHSMSLCKCFQNRESKASHLFLISFSIQGKAFGVMRWRQLAISIFSLSSAHVSLPPTSHHPPLPCSSFSLAVLDHSDRCPVSSVAFCLCLFCVILF